MSTGLTSTLLPSSLLLETPPWPQEWAGGRGSLNPEERPRGFSQDSPFRVHSGRDEPVDLLCVNSLGHEPGAKVSGTRGEEMASLSREARRNRL